MELISLVSRYSRSWSDDFFAGGGWWEDIFAENGSWGLVVSMG
jgi:hypothetical protein